MFVSGRNCPPGVNRMDGKCRMPVLRVVSGDTWTVDAHAVTPCGCNADPSNSVVEFVLSENQFSPPLWTGTWMSGILPDENRKGLVHVEIPRELTKALRRGSYMFSMRVSDRLGHEFRTILSGNFLVEYMPTSDQRSIPYRDGTSEIFGTGVTCDSDDGSSPVPEDRHCAPLEGSDLSINTIDDIRDSVERIGKALGANVKR